MAYFFRENTLHKSAVSKFQNKSFKKLKPLKEFFEKKHFIKKITIFEDFQLICEIEISGDGENIFPEKISHDL